MRQSIGLFGDNGCLDRNLLGIGALLADVADAEDFIANAQVLDPVPDSGNDAGEIAAENVGEPRELARLALAHLPVGAVDAGGDDVDHDLAGCSHGIRHLAEFQNVRSTVAFDEGGFHGHSSLWPNWSTRQDSFRSRGTNRVRILTV